MARSRALVVQLFLSILLVAACPLSAFAIDTDGDGVDDSVDAFPNHKEASVDTDGDGKPDLINDSSIPVFEDFEQTLSGWTMTGDAGVVHRTPFSGTSDAGITTSTTNLGSLSKSANAGKVIFFASPSVSKLWIDNIEVSPTCTASGKTNWKKCVINLASSVHTLKWEVMILLGNYFLVDEIRISSLTEDIDDDNDGTADTADAFPLNAAESIDTDHDGIGNNADPDDDNDGEPDGGDNCPLNANPDQVDTDGDAQGNACDNDDDNDSVADAADACPLDSSASSGNADGDSLCDFSDPDDDNDGMLDGTDNCQITANADQADRDGDGKGDVCDLLVSQPLVIGDNYACALTSAGGVKCWGFNAYGQLGDNTTTNKTTPVDVMGLADGVAVIATASHTTCALTTVGGVKCWGQNNYGQLGDNSTINRSIPVNVVGLGSGVAAIAVGSHTCALTSAGGVKCWGSNTNGQLGNNSITNRSTPVNVVGLDSGVVAIAVGYYHTCALTAAGGVKCWGRNDLGQLGDNSTTNRTTPVNVVGLDSGVVAIALGALHTCALTAAGAVKCWGYNYYGQLGDNSTTQRNAPVDVASLGSVATAMTTFPYHNCAVTTTGSVKCWGDNNYGQLGDNSYTQRNAPVDVVGLSSDLDTLVASDSHACALTTARGVKCWGYNYYGQLGDNTTTDRLTPVDVVELSSGVATIAVGHLNSCALTTAGEVKCWGFNAYGQLGNNSTIDKLTPVDVLGGPFYVGDTDGDGVLDNADAFPFNASESVDTDNDGIGNNSDVFPLNAAESLDTDADGTGNNADPDDDNDATPDVMDPLPLQAKFNMDAGYKGSQVRDGVKPE